MGPDSESFYVGRHAKSLLSYNVGTLRGVNILIIKSEYFTDMFADFLTSTGYLLSPSQDHIFI